MDSVFKSFVSDWHVYIIITLMGAVMYLVFTRPQAGDKSLISQLFHTNEDLDTTLALLLKAFTVFGVFVIVFTMVIVFHDDVKDKAGMILISAISMITLAMRDMFPSGGKQ